MLDRRPVFGRGPVVQNLYDPPYRISGRNSRVELLLSTDPAVPPTHPMFDRIALINLDHRKDRLGSFQAKVIDIPSLQGWTRYRAIHGDKVSVPHFFTSGGGAWGCRQSHCRILEDAILDNVNTLLVLEDDVKFCKNFEDRFREFMKAVPDDWEGLMLGGQNQAPPQETGIQNVFRAVDTQRTHAYVVRGVEPMRDLYRLWMRCDRHIDHWFGQWQQKRVVYQPQPFLCGQDESSSDISGKNDTVRYWNPAVVDNRSAPIHVLQCSRVVFERLRTLGFHAGYSRDPVTGHDKGIINIAESGWPEEQLSEWARVIVFEAAERNDVPGLWHTPIPDRAVLEKRLGRPVVFVQAGTAQEAVEKIPGLAPAWVAAGIVWCWQGQGYELLEGLAFHGFHRGHWKDEISGLDQGIRNAVDNNRYDLIKGIVRQLRRESEKVRNGKVLLAHPALDVARVREELAGESVHELTGTTIRELMGQYGESLNDAVEMYRK
jgi:hypothetical protein